MRRIEKAMRGDRQVLIVIEHFNATVSLFCRKFAMTDVESRRACLPTVNSVDFAMAR